MSGQLRRRRWGGTIALGAATVVALGSLLVVALRGPEPPATMQGRVQAVAETLRCPECRDLSVADSPAPLAREMRATIRRDLLSGMTPDRIRDRFVASYGETVLLSPPGHGIAVAAWVLPALIAALGAVAALFALRRWRVPALDAGPAE